MDHSDEKPASDTPARHIGPGSRLSNQQRRMRQWQAKAAQAEISDGRVGRPKRRQPSMPILPWDNSK